MNDIKQVAGDLADQIELELKELKLWNDHLQVDSKLVAAFGADQLSFEEWLQAVLVPRLRSTVDRGPLSLPTSSNLAIAGIRNFDGIPGLDRLLGLLAKVDELVEARNPAR